MVLPRPSPTTPRSAGSREISPDHQFQHYSNRRPSMPEPPLPLRSSYRQSNLSFSTPRTYNSSPLGARPADMASEAPRLAESTESTISTTAPSTVWDELEDLKSRIHRLELTGKLPPSSGAAMSRVSHERPRTATTTVTTVSSSPKQRGRANSISAVEPAAKPAPPETHALLHSALTKTKPLLSSEVYKALETTAADALSLSSMMGISGQTGPISSSQSTSAGTSSVSDRQVRRKAEGMCRSLTELCLALSEGQAETPVPASSQTTVRPGSQDSLDTEVRSSIESDKTQMQLVTTEIARLKSSPKALSRLEARRSSLLATSALPSPRYVSSEAGTPTYASATGRRASLFLRPQRAATEDPEEEKEARFRAPSRATTDLARFRQSPREYTSQQPLPERTLSVQTPQSSLPVRRHYQSTSLTNTIPASKPPVSLMGTRKFLDRSTPDRDTANAGQKSVEDRAKQRPSSMGYGNLQTNRPSSLDKRPRPPNSADSSAGQLRKYE